MGPKTTPARQALPEAHGLKADGVAGPATLQALGLGGTRRTALNSAARQRRRRRDRDRPDRRVRVRRRPDRGLPERPSTAASTSSRRRPGSPWAAPATPPRPTRTSRTCTPPGSQAARPRALAGLLRAGPGRARRRYSGNLSLIAPRAVSMSTTRPDWVTSSSPRATSRAPRAAPGPSAAEVVVERPRGVGRADRLAGSRCASRSRIVRSIRSSLTATAASPARRACAGRAPGSRRRRRSPARPW